MTSEYNDTLENILHTNGYSLTSARMAVFQTLKSSEPLYMKELCTTLTNIVDRASIYRIVDLFEKLHITDRLNIGWKYKIELSDVFSDHHHHIICTNCHIIQDLDENSELESTMKSLGKKHGFAITNHQIELRGICAECSITLIM